MRVLKMLVGAWLLLVLIALTLAITVSPSASGPVNRETARDSTREGVVV